MVPKKNDGKCASSDPTGEIFITLWEDHIDYVQEQIETGCTSFAFHGIRLKQFGKKVYLTSISSTIITTVDAITPCEKRYPKLLKTWN